MFVGAICAFFMGMGFLGECISEFGVLGYLVYFFTLIFGGVVFIILGGLVCWGLIEGGGIFGAAIGIVMLPIIPFVYLSFCYQDGGVLGVVGGIIGVILGFIAAASIAG